MNRRLLYLALFLSLGGSLFAQQLKVPQASPHAVVEETLGVTSISVDYHRPAVNNRKIFGGLVPYDVLWRAGANQPTHIMFSTPVKVEGQDVPAGTYSLFFIPGQQEWTLVLSKFTGGWGTYSYDQSEDLVRVKVTPQPADMTERMAFTFDDAKDNGSVNLAMRWEKTRVPVKIEADTKKLVAEGIRRDLRSELYWNPPAWVQAAGYMLRNGNEDLALQYVNHAIEMQPDAGALRMKARIIEKKDAEGAKALRAQAEKLITPEVATVSNAYRLISQKKYDEAIAAIGDNKSWRALNAIGDAWAAKGDKAKAMEWYDKAMGAAGNQTERVEVQDSINALGADTKS
jgi:hypothetical protein